jgi:glycosyltransferase involved in cell wall biosynthesis
VVRWSDRIEVHYCGTGRQPFKLLGYIFRGPVILRNQVRDFNPDIVHYQIGGNFLFTKLGALKGIPSLLTIHGIAFEEARVSRSWKKKLNMYWNGMMSELMRPKNIINISSYSRNLMHLKGAERHPIIYNAVAMHFFEIPSNEGMKNRLLYVGVINERKNLLLLMEAMAQLKQMNISYQLDVIGGPDEDPSYYNRAVAFAEAELGGQVVFHGWRSQDELTGFLSGTDLVVLPSKQETLPMSVAEAMAAGKVVLASEVGGIPEMIINAKNGYLFPAGDMEALVAILQKLYNNNADIRRVSEAARSWIYDKCNNVKVAQHTISYYRQILGWAQPLPLDK